MRIVIRPFLIISSIYLFLGLAACGSGVGNVPNSTSHNVDPPPPNAAQTPPPILPDRPKIVAFGDSLTAGTGLDTWEKSYPALLQQDIDRSGFDYQVLNQGRPGDTSKAALERLPEALRIANIKVVILELGANDIIKNVPPDEIKRNLAEIITQVKTGGASVLLCGIEPPERVGSEYRKMVLDMYLNLAREKDVLLMPSFMDRVADHPELILPDGVHPNEDGARVIEKNVFAALQPLLKSKSELKKK
ncbi:MAG TPA: arylesterase [Pyrinomonadaceae bacterium]|jgi:acyl-CoA thioesterase-1|nr:arylesterase [Pyrinomonadaceae bacterium]